MYFPKEILVSTIDHAIEYIEDPEHWTQGSLVRSADDSYCADLEKPNVKVCALGSFMRSARNLHCDVRVADTLAIRWEMQYGVSISRFNDTNDHNIVVAKLREFREATRIVS